MWTDVLLTAAAERALCDGTRRARPRELVALLGGSARGATAHVRRVVPLPNAAARDDAFAVDPVAFTRAEATLRDGGDAFVGFAHSHPGGAAAPSRRDRQQLWTGCVQLVTACAAAGDDADVQIGAFVLDAPDRVRPLPLARERAP